MAVPREPTTDSGERSRGAPREPNGRSTSPAPADAGSHTAVNRVPPATASPAADESQPSSTSVNARDRRPPGEYLGVAVPRVPGSAPVPGWGWDHNAYHTHYHPSSWYWVPWGFGLGSWAYYDPWAWGPPYNYGYVTTYGVTHGATGAIRLKVTPREAQVFVDGYFAGTVDDFDGTFQRLRLEEGPHTISVRLDGYEPLEFKAYVTADVTITLPGQLRPVP